VRRMVEVSFVTLGVVALVALVAHETCHALACEVCDIEWSPTVVWGWVLPAPAIRMHDQRALTPKTLQVIAMAPLVMLYVPAIAHGTLDLSQEGYLLLAMWCFGAIPSPGDIKNWYYASEIDDWHGVWYGEHATHRAAEGV